MFSMTDLCPYVLPSEMFLGEIDTVTKYARLAILGQGPSSIVYQAKELATDKIFALKVIGRVPLDKDIPSEYFREITILKSLNHTNVIKLHSIFMDQNNIQLVLDYCVSSLDKYIDKYPRERILEDQVKCIAKQLFRGLNYLHKSYIVHRDIKPPNLLLSPSGILKIADFGLSRRYLLQSGASTPGAMTRWYQAPEILFGAPTYDSKVDMWSAACVIVEVMLRKPFLPGESDIQQINRTIDLIGTPKREDWPGFAECRVYKSICLKRQPYRKLADFCQEQGCATVMPLIDLLVVYDPKRRATAQRCLQHEWFERAPYPSSSIELVA